MNRRLIQLALPLALSLSACGEDDAPSLPSLLSESRDATAAECPSGGAVVLTGLDGNGDGTLNENEVASSSIVCSAVDGQTGPDGEAGRNALIRTTAEAAGANCVFGGQRIDSGLDANRDGVLQDDEIDATTYICDGEPGQDGADFLVSTVPGDFVECEGAGGIQILSGYDDDRDAVLDAEEVDSTEVVCFGQDGINFLIEVGAEAPGANCAGGGQQVRRGFDQDRSGTLEPTEVEDVQFLCNPVATLVTTSSIGTGADCASGGVRIDSGLDVNANQTLEPGEVNATQFVCDGQDGTTVLVRTSSVAPGADCENGGLRVETGRDLDLDGSLSPTEVERTTFACDGDPGLNGRGNSAVRLSREPAGADCPSGGTRIESGPDTDGDGVLDDDEVTATRFACSGVSITTLVAVTVEPVGPNCLNGGQRIQEGIDDNLDGILDPLEVDATTFVCSPLSTLPIAITTMTVPDAVRGEGYSADLTARGGLGGVYTWTVVSGQLPPGFTLSASGNPAQLSGTATATGTFSFTVAVTDFVGSVSSIPLTLAITPPPCEPGFNGLVTDGATTVAITSAPSLASAFGIAADSDPSGWVYIVGTSELTRVRKDGSASEDLEANTALAGLNLGYDIEISGNDIYVLDDSSTSTIGRLQRISTDAGQTFGIQDMATFASNPDDFRGMAVAGSTIYLITQASSVTEIWSVDISGSLPAAATLVTSISGQFGCEGLDLDASYFYTVCSDVIRIDRSTFTVDVLTTTLGESSTYNAPVTQDADGDGITDVLWVQGFDDMVYVCNPSGPLLPAFAQPFGESEANADYGLALDPSNNQLWRYDDSPDELYRYD